MWFDSYLEYLVGDVLIKAYSCFVFEGKAWSDLHVGSDTLASYSVMNGIGNVHTHLSVETVLCLWGWTLPLCFEVLVEFCEENVSFLY